MNTFKTLVLALAVLGVASFSAAQQAGPAGGVKAGKGAGQGKGAPGQGQRGMGPGMMARLGEIEDKALAKVNPTADQKKQIAALRTKEKPAREAFMKKLMDAAQKNQGQAPAAGGQGRRMQLSPELMEEGKKLQESHNDAMKKILGEAKFKQFEEALKAERQSMRPGGPGGPGGAGAAGGKGKKGGGTPPPQN